MRGLGVCDLRHGVLPRALTRAAHDEQVSGSGIEPNGSPAALRPQQEPPLATERDDGDEGFGKVTRHPVAVPCDAVAPVAIEVRPDRRELDAVAHR